MDHLLFAEWGTECLDIARQCLAVQKPQGQVLY